MKHPSDDLERIRALCHADRAEPAERLQRLWSGYGEVRRVRLHGAPRASVVVKVVDPPPLSHPPGGAEDRSHARKLRSYQVERTFYETLGARCGPSCRAPAFLGGWTDGARSVFVLEDLDAAGFTGRRRDGDSAGLAACVGWLAAFHACFLGASTEGLWPVGTYWHLATRPDELQATDDRRLRAAAAAIDDRLQAARFQTLVHGDAKLANFCFGPAGAVAAVDFQYVGGGCGMKDLAYLLSSALPDRDLPAQEPAWVDLYFERLRAALQGGLDASGRSIDIDALEAEWRSLLPWAWADFVRFLAGWSPGHWKLERHARHHALAVLDLVLS